MKKKQHRQIIVEKDHNSICFCEHCQRVSIAYGRTLLSLEAERFEDFVVFLGEAFEKHFSQHPERELRLRFSEVYLCFNPSEAQSFLALAQEAWTEICRQRLEELFQA